MMPHIRLLLTGWLCFILIACQATPAPTGAVATPSGTAARASVRVTIVPVSRFTVKGAPATAASVHHYQFTLRDAGTQAPVATVTTSPGVNTATFYDVGPGTYDALVDAQDASNASLVQGGPQPTSNTVTVSGAVSNYSTGTALVADLQLLDGTGGTVPVTITNPYPGGFGELINPTTGELISHYNSPTSNFHLLQVVDGTYGFWGFGVSGGVATPPRRAADVTVSGYGAIVSGPWNLTIPGLITTTIGGGPTRDNGLTNPTGIATDAAGNLYVADTGGRRVRFMPTTNGTYFGQTMHAWTLYTIAGTGVNGDSGDGGPATAARFRTPTGVAVDAQGNVFVTDSTAHRVRVIAAVGGPMFGIANAVAGNIYTLAGTGASGGAASGVAGTTATLNTPSYLACDPAGNVVVSDRQNHRIRVVFRTAGTWYGISGSAGYVYTLAGTGTTSPFNGDDIPAATARINQPTGVAVDGQFNVFYSDQNNRRVRVIAQTVTPIFHITTPTVGNVYTVAGTGVTTFNGDSQSASTAQLNSPQGLHLTPSGDLLVSDNGHWRLRLIARDAGTRYSQTLSPSFIYTVAGNGVAGTTTAGTSATATSLPGLAGVTSDPAGNVLVCDANGAIYRIALANGSVPSLTALNAGVLHLLAGNGAGDDFGQGGLPADVALAGPMYARQHANGDLAWTDNNLSRVWFQPAANGTYYGQPMTAGRAYVIAGNGQLSGPADGWTGVFAAMSPRDLCFGAGYELFISDGANRRVWRLDPNGTLSLFAGNGVDATAGDGGPATNASFRSPWGLAYRAGVLYIADNIGRNVRRVSGGIVQPFAGSPTGVGGNAGDGGPPGAALFMSPASITFDTKGHFYIGDQGNLRLRMIPAATGTYYGVPMAAGTINTAVSGFSAYSLSVDTAGHVLYADISLPNFVSLSGAIFRLVGLANGFGGDGGPAALARVNFPTSATFLQNGDVLVCDWGNARIRVIH